MRLMPDTTKQLGPSTGLKVFVQTLRDGTEPGLNMPCGPVLPPIAKRRDAGMVTDIDMTEPHLKPGATAPRVRRYPAFGKHCVRNGVQAIS